MTLHQKTSIGFFVVLLGAASLNYIPGVTDADGVAFGVFALDIFDDALHLASAIWALVAGLMSSRAARQFLLIFGALYLGDGVLGLITGSGYLDFGIFNYGVQDLPFGFKILANLPHIGLGAIALASGLFLRRAK
ncbi:MAG: hypothetical protein KJO30_03610 [Boseongicola sp.]|nr:hypothetical protein [Boseongicola sp.]NNJ68122.1 hypothetical protein [Boseongicola sp.]